MIINHSNFIKHKYYRDVCVKSSIKYYGPYYVIKGEYWNLGSKKSYPMNIPFRDKMLQPELKDWLTFDKRESLPIGIKSLRYANWIPMVKG